VIENNYLEAAGENLMFGGSDPAIPNLVPDGITVRRNVLAKPFEWRDPIVATPAGVRAAASRTGGALGPGAYTYRVAAERPSGQGTTAVSRASEAVTVALERQGAAEVEWSPVEGAAAYRVYRDGPGGTVAYRVGAPSFTDTGAAGRAGNPPKRGTTWSVKNLFELKNARNVVVEGNVLEGNWLAAQTGYAILLKSENQNGRAPWSVVEQVRIVNNVIRHVSAAINILGVDQRRESGRLRHVTIANNLFTDVSRENWGGTGDFLLIGGGPADVTIERNTVQHTGRVIAAYGGSRGPKQVERFVFRDNLMRHNRYGVKGDDAAVGKETLERYFPGARFEGNVLAGGKPALYPPGNHFPPVQELEALSSGAPRRRASASFGQAGADIAAIEAATGTSAGASRVTPRASTSGPASPVARRP
jgi:hypothetical protein